MELQKQNMENESSETHTVKDDIIYQYMKELPKRTGFYSAHRKLSTEFDRDVKFQNKDRELRGFELDRSYNSMSARLSKLQEKQKNIRHQRRNRSQSESEEYSHSSSSSEQPIFKTTMDFKTNNNTYSVPRLPDVEMTPGSERYGMMTSQPNRRGYEVTRRPRRYTLGSIYP